MTSGKNRKEKRGHLSNRNRSDRAENQRSASRSTRSERAAEMDDRDYDREREGGRYRSNTRTDASDDRRRSNSGGTRSRGTSARSRERSQDIDDRYMKQMMKNWILTEQIIGGNAYDGGNEQMVFCT